MVNQTVLELDFRAVKFLFFPRRDLNPHHCYYTSENLNQTVLELDFQSCQIFVLPSTGFEPTPLLHCSTIRLALRPAP